MEEPKIRCCKLCFTTIKDEHYEVINSNSRKILVFLLSKLDFDDDDDDSKLVMCNVCSANISAAQKFKMTCLYTDNTIASHVVDTLLPVDLREIYVKEKVRERLTDDIKVCRLCMRPIKSVSEFNFLNEELVNMILKFAPEMNIFIVKEPVICNLCWNSLVTHSNFLKQCSVMKQNIENACGGQLPDAPSPIQLVDIPIKVEDDIGVKIEDVNVKFEKDVLESIKTECMDMIDEGIKFESEMSYQKISEVTTYNDQPMYKCENCNYATRHRGNLRRHMLVHKDPVEVQMYKCQDCNYESKLKRNLKRHMLTHKDPSEVQMYNCEDCNYESKFKDDLRNHTLMHKDPSEVQMYKCEYCNYVTKFKRSLNRHMLIHKDPSEVQMYKCEYCNYETKFKRSLKRHMLIHKDPSEVQMYNCEDCNYESKFKDGLKNHMLMHRDPSEVLMYKCEHCNCKTRDKKYFKMHQLIHNEPSEVRIYNCDYCNYESMYKSTLKRHMLKHRDPPEVKMYKKLKNTF